MIQILLSSSLSLKFQSVSLITQNHLTHIMWSPRNAHLINSIRIISIVSASAKAAATEFQHKTD